MPRVEPVPYEDLSEQYRSMIEAGAESGRVHDPGPVADPRLRRSPAATDDAERHPNFPNSLLEPRLLELLRIRSGQLGGCEPCIGSRKEGTITEDDVACLANPALRPDITVRERHTLAFLDQLSNDHWAIGDDTFRDLHEVFTTGEIIDLGQTVGGMIGLHRFLHTLDAFGENDPVIKYDPHEVGTTWGQLHGG